MSSTYPIDEFENPDIDSPVGAHRRPPSRWRPVLPFLLILLLVPLLAWGFTVFLQRGGSGLVEGLTGQSGLGAQSSQSGQSGLGQELQSQDDPQSDPASTPEETPSEQPEESPEPTETPTVDTIDYDIAVEVLNETFIQGYAAEVAGYLTADGFTSVTAGNTSGWLATVNTVYYSEESEEAAARRIAELAGIDAVELNTNATEGVGIVVLLVD